MSVKKATRAERRAKRKENRQNRKALLNNLIEKAKNFNFDIDLDGDNGQQPKFEEVFTKIWPVMGPGIKYLELHHLTGEKTDKVLASIYDLGEQISEGDADHAAQTKFVEEFTKIWSVVRIGLAVVENLVDGKTEDVIEDIIDVGDWMTGREDD